VDNKRQILRDLVEKRCLVIGDFTLSTGQKSKFYFDCKHATLDGEALALISDAFLEEIAKFEIAPTAIGGLTMGADFIAAAVAMRAFQTNAPTIHASIVRKEPKKHGTRNYIENQLERGTSIVVVDDVITTGSSTVLACERFKDAGYNIVGILALVDREAGGLTNLADKFQCQARSIFTKSDFPALMEGSGGVEGSLRRMA
jgi:orotate phosphoribosyltransferase